MEKSITGQMEWSILRGLLENIAYGGRIDNNQDLKVSEIKIYKMNIFLTFFFSLILI